MQRFFALLVPALLLMTNCASYMPNRTHGFTAVEQLAYQIEIQMAEPELETAFIGLMVQSVETGEILFQHNAKKVMLPASNEKIPTAAATLIRFGPDFQLQTKLYSSGNIVDGVLHGDLIVVGGGDPTIGPRLCELQEQDSCAFFEAWADGLKSKGIFAVDGNIIGVDNIFDDEAIGYGWTLDNLSYSYSAQIGGLTFHENKATLRIHVDSTASSSEIMIEPDYGNFFVSNRTKLTIDKHQATDLVVQRIEGGNELILSGTLLAGKSYRQGISVHNPTAYFLRGLRYELAKSGIRISGDEIDSDDLPESPNPDSLQLIYVHYSPPMQEMLKILMKESQNLYAETFVKLLGAHFGNEGSFKEGRKVLQQTLVRLGLEPTYYSYKDGSGLTRYNYISPYYLTKIFRRMYYHPYGAIFQDILPVAGIDGTIGYRMKGTVAEGRVQAKTGTISNVRCLSGYVTTADDEQLTFSIMVNNFLCSVQVVMDLQDRICMLLSSFSREN